jgi:hypothetical protein
VSNLNGSSPRNNDRARLAVYSETGLSILGQDAEPAHPYLVGLTPTRFFTSRGRQLTFMARLLPVGLGQRSHPGLPRPTWDEHPAFESRSRTRLAKMPIEFDRR